ncbi:MAG: hypothetical protein KF729_19555 [Sandaracinaceae bacterium]|nr:hypothetical protein [Sandaracinaceae bacterium]
MTRLALALAAFALAACNSPLAIGDECSDSVDCMEGTSCFHTDSTMTRSVCMADCDQTTTHICATGELCLAATLMGAPRELGVCFLGGETLVGGACTDTFECARGSLCVDVGGTRTCYRACRTDDTTRCLATERCEGLVGMGMNGYCAPAAP